MLAFYFDYDVRSAIAEGLRNRRVEVLMASEDGRLKADDENLLPRATELDRVLVTHDTRFHRIAKRWRGAGRDFSGILFATQDQSESGQVVEYLTSIAHALSSADMRNRLEFVQELAKSLTTSRPNCQSNL